MLKFFARLPLFPQKNNPGSALGPLRNRPLPKCWFWTIARHAALRVAGETPEPHLMVSSVQRTSGVDLYSLVAFGTFTLITQHFAY